MSILENLLKSKVKSFFSKDSRDYFKIVVKAIKDVGMYPEVNVISGPSCQSRITINGKSIHLGMFDNEKNASNAYKKAVSLL